VSDEALPISDSGAEESMDSLFKIAVDQEKVSEIKKDSQMEEGTYVRSENPATVTLNKHPKTGRQGLAVFAGIENAKSKGAVRFRLSWERQNKVLRDEATGEESDTGKPDLQSRLYAQAVDVYKRAHDGAAPGTIGDLATFLQQAPYRLKLMNGDESEVVLSIFPPTK
jgi:hypothetical protein